jgi:hypothetical protein
VRRRDELDRLVRTHADRWAPERMSTVDRSILQVGALELLEGDVPPAVVLDEAVDIAKHFSGDEAGRFVNGVLAAVLAELQADGGVVAGGGSSLGGSDGGSANGGSGGVDGGAGSAGGAGGGSGAGGGGTGTTGGGSGAGGGDTGGGSGAGGATG